MPEIVNFLIVNFGFNLPISINLKLFMRFRFLRFSAALAALLGV